MCLTVSLRTRVRVTIGLLVWGEPFILWSLLTTLTVFLPASSSFPVPPFSTSADLFLSIFSCIGTGPGVQKNKKSSLELRSKSFKRTKWSHTDKHKSMHCVSYQSLNSQLVKASKHMLKKTSSRESSQKTILNPFFFRCLITCTLLLKVQL